jgi:TolB-like protein
MAPDLTVRAVARGREAAEAGGEIPAAGRRLGVAFLVDGGLQGRGGRLRLTLRLIRLRDAVAVWAGVFDPDTVDGSSAVRQMAADAAAAIGAEIFRSDSSIARRSETGSR